MAPPAMMTFVSPNTPVRLHAGMAAPQKIVDRTPDYPARARAARISGEVVLDIVIDTNGDVQVIQILRSIPALDKAAIDAVCHWRFAPTLVNGEARVDRNERERPFRPERPMSWVATRGSTSDAVQSSA